MYQYGPFSLLSVTTRALGGEKQTFCKNGKGRERKEEKMPQQLFYFVGDE